MNISICFIQESAEPNSTGVLQPEVMRDFKTDLANLLMAPFIPHTLKYDFSDLLKLGAVSKAACVNTGKGLQAKQLVNCPKGF